MSQLSLQARRPMNGPVELALWACLALLWLALELAGIARQSLLGDEQQHLLAASQALHYGTNTLNLEHPPLAKLVAGLPLLLERPLVPPLAADQALSSAPRLFDQPAELLRSAHRGRLLVLLTFGLPWLVSLFFLGREVGGVQLGATLALGIGFAFPVLPQLGVIHTDVVVSLGYALVLLGSLRLGRQPSRGALLCLALGLAIAVASKFTGVLLAPAVLLALALARGERLGLARRLGAAFALALATLAALALTYGAANWGYRRAAGERALELYCRGQASLVAEERLQRFEAPLLGLAHYWPGGAQFAVGLLGVAEQNRIGVYPSYALGDLRSTGRWWYFPVVFALKTPLALLVALAAALVAALRRLRLAQISAGELLARARPFAPMLSLVFLYLALALSSNYNIGFRHLLPVLPILYLPAVAWAARKRWRALALVGILALESVALTPAWVAATNTWWLGAANPTRFALSGGDLDARQGFLLLGTEAERLGVEELGVLYPLLPPEELHAYLPRARAVQPGEPLRAGWYAVSASLEQYVPALLGAPSGPLHGREGLMELARAWQPSLEALRGGEDHGYLAGTFHLYRLPPPSG